MATLAVGMSAGGVAWSDCTRRNPFFSERAGRKRQDILPDLRVVELIGESLPQLANRLTGGLVDDHQTLAAFRYRLQQCDKGGDLTQTSPHSSLARSSLPTEFVDVSRSQLATFSPAQGWCAALSARRIIGGDEGSEAVAEKGWVLDRRRIRDG